MPVRRLFPDHANGFDRLMRAAELALESTPARPMAAGACSTRSSIAPRSPARPWRRSCERALEQGELLLHYQPQVDLAAGRVLAVEALLRWQHPERGLVAPQTFIPIAEASGLIRPIGAWVLAEACRATRRWHEQGIPIGISVNVSGRPAQAPGPAGDGEPGPRGHRPPRRSRSSSS